MEQLERIVRAVEMRNPDAARAASAMNLVESERWLREVVQAEVTSGVELGAIAAGLVDPTVAIRREQDPG
ncbi:hypothetical protein PSU4_59210 [Pseudonocardia sulfidoxydans NBRC 16205]|uniref:Uncharacterized protein n=1 Tax=Pseudonocardia sulfidoxydans NBRC 16205 TaxID=1223511 RepID=A0A511DRN3_9PSEU|nr:hypothetical protein [Pseudonocardia sulfidoxydans]GEL26967.1 hypothetical protein PSU4_59210 [Pseudonocardia sulfidoxydans NBRC 16205]